MKRAVVIKVSLGFLAFVGFGRLIELEPETRKSHELKGRVKKLTITCDFFDDWNDWALPRKIIIHFNEFGKAIFKAYYEEYGDLMEYEHVYDENGTLQDIPFFEEVVGITELVINELGKIEIMVFDDADGFGDIRAKYEERGQLAGAVLCFSRRG